MTGTARRHLVLLAAAIMLGTGLGGAQVLSVLAAYRPFPFPSPLVLAPVVGLLVYWWTRGVREVLGVLTGVTTVALAVVVAAVSVPVAVIDASAAGAGALYQLGIFQALVGVLPVVPLVALTTAFASALDSETGLLRRYHSRGRPTATLAVVTVGGAVLVVLFAGVVGANYASVAAQSQVEASVVGVDTEDGAVQVAVEVPNRLADTMYVRSVVLDVELNGTQTVRASETPRAQVQPGNDRTVVVSVEALSPAEYRHAESVRITGVVRFWAFGGYEGDLSVATYTARE